MKNKKTRIRVTRTGRRLLYLFVGILVNSILLISCNVTRQITTESKYFQSGDTTTTIVTKTVEVYDASKK